MDIGTAKPTIAEQHAVPHHVIDVVEPSESYGLSQYQEDALAAITEINARDGWPIMVGGTGLYVQAVVDQLKIPGQYPDVRRELEADPDTRALHARLTSLDAVAASRMEPNNRRRVLRALEVAIGSGRPFSDFGPGIDAYPPTDHVLVGIDRERPDLDTRIAARYEQQMTDGFFDEVTRLAALSPPMSATARQALGYKELLDVVAGTTTLAAALALANKRTRRFARRQQSWFRRDPRTRWYDGGRNPLELATQILTDLASPATAGGREGQR